MSDWAWAVVAVTAFVLFMAVVFGLVTYFGWRSLAWRDDDEE